MQIPPRNGISTSVNSMQQLHAPVSAPARSHKSTAQNFDQITISSEHSVDSRFQMELKSRLSREVRTATTTGTLADLRRQIEAGEYQVDPVAIARRMLLVEGGF